MTIEPLEIEMVDCSKLELYQANQPIEKPKTRPRRLRGLSFRCPREIRLAKKLKIERSGKCHGAHNHNMVIINDLELCPVSAIMFLIAAKNYQWSDGLKAAVGKIMEEAYES